MFCGGDATFSCHLFNWSNLICLFFFYIPKHPLMRNCLKIFQAYAYERFHVAIILFYRSRLPLLAEFIDVLLSHLCSDRNAYWTNFRWCHKVINDNFTFVDIAPHQILLISEKNDTFKLSIILSINRIWKNMNSYMQMWILKRNHNFFKDSIHFLWVKIQRKLKTNMFGFS